eukprot:7322423-Prymnesium_polylepis.1
MGAFDGRCIGWGALRTGSSKCGIGCIAWSSKCRIGCGAFEYGMWQRRAAAGSHARGGVRQRCGTGNGHLVEVLVTWGHMGSHAVTWGRMGSQGGTWGRMGSHGVTWGHMGSPGRGTRRGRRRRACCRGRSPPRRCLKQAKSHTLDRCGVFWIVVECSGLLGRVGAAMKGPGWLCRGAQIMRAIAPDLGHYTEFGPRCLLSAATPSSKLGRYP